MRYFTTLFRCFQVDNPLRHPMISGVLRSLFTFHGGGSPPSPLPQKQPADLLFFPPPILSKWSRPLEEQYLKLSELKIITFNMLAPCYKRLPPTPEVLATVENKNLIEKGKIEMLRRSSIREASRDFLWKDRAKKTIDFFHSDLFGADIIALQEFWLEETYSNLFYAEMKKEGYEYYTFQRSGTKMDAVAILVKSSAFEVVKVKNVILSRFGDRVALLLWLRFKHSGTKREGEEEEESNILLANTHLSFPHNDFDRLNQIEQVKTLTGWT